MSHKLPHARRSKATCIRKNRAPAGGHCVSQTAHLKGSLRSPQLKLLHLSSLLTILTQFYIIQTNGMHHVFEIPELLLEICWQVYLDEIRPFPGTRRRNLRRLSRTCRFFYRIAHPIIWHYMQLDYPRSVLEIFPEDLWADSESNTHYFMLVRGTNISPAVRGN